MVVLVKVGHLVVNIYDGERNSLRGHVMKISRVTVLVMYGTRNDCQRKAVRHAKYTVQLEIDQVKLSMS